MRRKVPEFSITVPQTAVQQDANGYFVLALDRENTLEMRRISVGRQINNNWLVSDGLATGERVIVQGIQKAGAGKKVNPTLRDKPEQGS